MVVVEEFQRKLEDANNKIYVADHMLSGTYQMLQDPKLLIAILDNVQLAMTFGLSGFLEHERMFKRIGHYSKNPESELNFFKLKIAKQYGFDDTYIKEIDRLRELLKAHKDSPVEFSRNSSFVIANSKYDLKKITAEDLKKDIKTCKDFLKDIAQKID